MNRQDAIVEGNAYKLIKQVPSGSIDLIITDPPYDIKGIHGAGVCRDRKYQKQMTDLNLGEGIDPLILDEFLRVLKKCNIYIWCNKEQIYGYLDFFTKRHNFNFDMIIWAKTNVPPFTSTHYLKDKEYCLYFWEKGVKLTITYETGRTVYVTKTNTGDKKLYRHPTIKPQPIIENMIRNSGGEILLYSIRSAEAGPHAQQPKGSESTT